MHLAYQYKGQYAIFDQVDGGWDFTFYDEDLEEITSGTWYSDVDDEEEVCYGIADYVEDDEVKAMCGHVDKWEEYDGDEFGDELLEMSW